MLTTLNLRRKPYYCLGITHIRMAVPPWFSGDDVTECFGSTMIRVWGAVPFNGL